MNEADDGFPALLCAQCSTMSLKYSKAFKLLEIWAVTSQVGSAQWHILPQSAQQTLSASVSLPDFESNLP